MTVIKKKLLNMLTTTYHDWRTYATATAVTGSPPSKCFRTGNHCPLPCPQQTTWEISNNQFKNVCQIEYLHVWTLVSDCLCLYLSVSVCLYIYMSVCLSICVLLRLSVDRSLVRLSMRTFLSLEAVKKYESSSVQAHDHITLEWTLDVWSVLATILYETMING